MNDNWKKWQPFIYGILVAAGVGIGILLRPAGGFKLVGGQNKLNEVLSIIQSEYVDTVNTEDIETNMFNEMLNQLDPHSVYIPAKDLQAANEPLEGNFEGIGVEFNIMNDTIMIVSAINGGPSADLGIMSGDRIIKADTTLLAGVGISNEQVIKTLRGKKGSSVKVTIYRPSSKQKIEYTIVRNTIPIYSVDASLMLDEKTGYIKISRFGAKTHDEFMEALVKLKKQHMLSLIIDLRGNPGGYLNAATEIVDELLDETKMIVYTQGLNKPKQTYETQKEGLFETGKLAVLMDEGSASASEILIGAVQDWDRGIIVGRRSFGKGLVQEPFQLSDGSAIRLTVARYYTPSGRCIQKNYSDGLESYEEDIMKRYESGELESVDKNKINDTTKYFTLVKKRVVYGGGGILPDVKVPIDTSFNTQFLLHVAAAGLLNKVSYQYVDANRTKLKAYKNVDEFSKQFTVDEALMNTLVNAATNEKIAPPSAVELSKSAGFIKQQLKALIARQIWRDGGFYSVSSKQDKTIQKALQTLNQQ
jgi:carboxyl-terminal processing protease